MTTTAPLTTEPPTAREMLQEIQPVLEVVPVAGPPVALVAGPWLVFVLMLTGPFALLVTLAVLTAAALALTVVAGAVAFALVAAPYVLVRKAVRLLAHRPDDRRRPVVVAAPSREARA